jgi:hypothetical protein
LGDGALHFADGAELPSKAKKEETFITGNFSAARKLLRGSRLPSRRVHEALDSIFLGRKFSQVHKLIDLPVRSMGKKHRALFHDPLSAIAIGYAVGGLGGAMSALLHIAVDSLFTELKKQRRSC